MMRFARRSFLRGYVGPGIAAAALSGQAARAQQKEHRPITIISGGPTGAWYPTAAAIAELVNAGYRGQPVNISPGKGAVSNPLSVGSGEVEVGLSFGPFLRLAYEGRNEVFDMPGFDSLRAVGNIGVNTFQIVMGADVPDDIFDQLKGGRRVSMGIGAVGSSTHFGVNKFLQEYGVDYESLRRNGSRLLSGASQSQTDAYKNRQIDIYFNTIGINAAVMQEAVTARASKLYSIPDRVRQAMASKLGYIPSVIPANTYPGQSGPVNTLDLSTIVFARADLSEAMVYDITRAMAENKPRLVAAFAGFAGWEPEDLAKGLPIPVHPGAARYFRERGWAH
ncbi:TAXI family TRAP transporter solute-binding subunit [Elioraea sp.]|jgi:TRAP transporter TAXI family solute receptor|uniref:TAXI family TRAP transporter solute-binding subunit n=1 Tax=Elioraea sp. TaxID=2185103 RepID=UPI003F701556